MGDSNNNPGQTDPNATPKEDVVITTPFDNIDTSLLDDDAVAKLEEGKKQFIETAKAKLALEDRIQRQNDVTAKYQSEADKAKAELARLKGSEPAKQQDPYLARATEFLRARGATDEEIAKTGKFYADMFRENVSIAKEEMSKELAPLAGTVINQNATLQFQTAMQQCEQMQHPEVAAEVWKAVEQYSQQGQAVDSEWMANYAKMVFVDKKLYLPQNQSQTPQPPTPFPSGNPPIRPPMSTGTVFNFPGSHNFRPIATNVPDPNAPKTMLNDETRSALQQVFSRMGTGLEIYPKNFTPPKHQHNPNNRRR